MYVTQALLDELKAQSDISWYQSKEKSPNGDLLIESITTNLKQANEILKGLNPSLKATVHYCSEKNEYTVRFEHKAVKQLLARNEPLMKKQLAAVLAYTNLAKAWHGDKPIAYHGEQWHHIGTEMDFSEPSTPTKLVSLVGNNSCERLFFDRTSPIYQDLVTNIETQCEGKPVDEILKIVYTTIDNISSKHPSVAHLTRDQVEQDLTQRVKDYTQKRAKEQGPYITNPDITMDELIKEGLLVCRHKAILAAAVIGALIQKKLLPQGSARQYRNLIHDRDGRYLGAHAWAVYHNIATDLMQVIDPRWMHVKSVSPKKPEDIGYGVFAVRDMIQRIDVLDQAKIEGVLMDAIQNASTLFELTQLIEDFAQKHDIVTTDGTILEEAQKQKLITTMKSFYNSENLIMLIANDDPLSTELTRKFGIRGKFIALAKEHISKRQLINKVKQYLESSSSSLPGYLAKTMIKPCLESLNELAKMPLSEKALKLKLKERLKQLELSCLFVNCGDLVMAIAQKAQALIAPDEQDCQLRMKPFLQAYKNLGDVKLDELGFDKADKENMDLNPRILKA